MISSSWEDIVIFIDKDNQNKMIKMNKKKLNVQKPLYSSVYFMNKFYEWK